MYNKLRLLTNKFYKLAYYEDDDSTYYEDDGDDELNEFLSEIFSLIHDEDIKRFGKYKIFLASLFDVVNKYRVKEDKLSWEKFAENLLKLHLDSKIELVRADLVTAMDTDLVERSEIPYETTTFHFLETNP